MMVYILHLRRVLSFRPFSYLQNTSIFKIFLPWVISFLFLVALLVTIVQERAFAGPVEVFGYARSEISASDGKTSDLLLRHKIRFDFESHFSNRLFIGGNVNLMTYRGDDSGNFLNNVPDSIAISVPPGARALFDYSFEDDVIWDNLFMKYAFPQFDLTVGKQQISFGSGYVWNPTDLFNVKNIIDPTDEKSGHKALRIDRPLSLSSRIMVLYDIADSSDESGVLIQYKTTCGHFDYSITLAEKYWSFTDYETFTGAREKRKLIGFDMAGEAFGVGLWFEGAYNWLQNSNDYYEFVLGSDYTWQNGFYLLMEYFHSSLGDNNSSDHDITSWMRSFTGEVKSISKDNLYVYGTYPLTDLMNIGMSVAWSISDGSFALIPVIDYSLLNDLHLEIFGGINLGKDDTAYSSELGNGLLVRLTWYF